MGHFEWIQYPPAAIFFCKRGEFLFYAAERLDGAPTWDRLPSLRKKNLGLSSELRKIDSPSAAWQRQTLLFVSSLRFVSAERSSPLCSSTKRNKKKRIRRFRAETKHLNKLLNYVFCFSTIQLWLFSPLGLKNWFWSSFYSSWNFKRAFGPLRVWLLPLKAVNYDRISKFGGTRFSQQHLPPSSRRRRPCFFSNSSLVRMGSEQGENLLLDLCFRGSHRDEICFSRIWTVLA